MKLILASTVLLSSINAVYSLSTASVECPVFGLKTCNDAILKAEDIDIFADELGNQLFPLKFNAYFLDGCQTFQDSLKKVPGCELCNLTHLPFRPNAIYCEEVKDDSTPEAAPNTPKAAPPKKAT